MRASIPGLLRRPQCGASNPIWTSMISNAACRENVCMNVGSAPVLYGWVRRCTLCARSWRSKTAIGEIGKVDG